MFSEENKVPRTLSEARMVAGSTTYKHSETVKQHVSSLKVSLFIQSWRQRKFDHLVCFIMKINVSMKIFLI